jgi:hypothetical protein
VHRIGGILELETDNITLQNNDGIKFAKHLFITIEIPRTVSSFEALDILGMSKLPKRNLLLLVTYSGDKFDFVKEIERFRRREFIWKHTHPIAFIYNDNLPKEVKDYAKQYSQGLNRIEFNLSDYKKTRGVEYQELFMFLDNEFWERINDGQQGLKTADWQQIACLHTFFSRPKDGLVIFVI